MEYKNHAMQDRLKLVYKYLRGAGKVHTQKELASLIGWKQTHLSSAFNGDSSRLTKGLMENISDAFPELNSTWLLTGEGDMLIENNDRPILATIHPDDKPVDDYRLIPLINIDSVGGIHSDNAIVPSEQYVMKMMPFTEAREGDVAILQSGNSMYPTIPSGSVLLIREVVDWKEYFGYGNIYVLWLKDGRRITKEIRRYDADPKNYVWCVSYNPNAADEELPRSLIRGVWKVVKYVADFGW